MAQATRTRQRKRNDATPFAALAFSVAIAAACGGKSVVVADDDAQAGDSASGKGGSSHTGGSSGKASKGGTGGGGTGGDGVSTGGSGGSRGGSGGSGGSRGGTGGSRGGTGGSSGHGGSAGVGGGIAGGGGFPVAGRGGAGSGGGGAPTAGFAGFAGTLVAGFGGNGCACDDNNPCTDDICDLGSCVYRYNTASCDDGNACTAGDYCSIGACKSGMPISCDDGNECTIDNCDTKGGCMYQEAGSALDHTERKIPDSELDCGPPSKSAVSTVTLEDAGNVANVSVSVGLEHTWGGDLTLVLAHDGVSVTLFDRFPGDGSMGDNFSGTYTFLAEGGAFAKVDTNSTIPPGNYQSLNPLAPFTGHPSAGDWTLTVTDGCHGDKGTVKGFLLNVSSTCTDDAMCTGTCTSGECLCLIHP